MKERPILFSAPMVRAILAGKKTQTRRVMKPQPVGALGKEWPDQDAWSWSSAKCKSMVTAQEARSLSPYGAKGDRLWVKETWTHDAPDLATCKAAHEDACPSIGYGPYYRATEVAPDTLVWRPSIFMPRWASRIALEVTQIRVERVQDINEADILADGCSVDAVAKMTGVPWSSMPTLHDAWSEAWIHINGNESWHANPWVWAISFARTEQR